MSTSQPPPSESPATLAPLWRVLEHAKASRQAAVDALVALSLRQVSLPTQKDSASSIYFVTDAQVGRLLPLFTSLALM